MTEQEMIDAALLASLSGEWGEWVAWLAERNVRHITPLESLKLMPMATAETVGDGSTITDFWTCAPQATHRARRISEA